MPTIMKVTKEKCLATQENIDALVIGGHFQGLGVIRALAREGIRVALVDSEPCMARFSKDIASYIHSPGVRNSAAFRDFLIEFARLHHLEGALIYPTDDETVFFLSKNRDVLSDVYRIATPDWPVIRYAYNKRYSYQLADSMGIAIPRTAYPESIDDLASIDIPFPLIIKPAVMRNFFRVTGKKVFRAGNMDELLSAYRQALKIIPADEILIQEEIPDVSHHLFSFCPLFKNGRILAHIVAKRSRQHPMDFGQASTLAETLDIPELVEVGSRILSEMDYYGVCEVEFIQDPRDDKYKFLEINPRIWGWHTLAVKAGVNLPYLLYQDMKGQSVLQTSFRKGVKWVRLTTDVPTVISEIMKGRMSPGDYIRSLRGEKTYAVLSRRDPLPFFGEFLLLPYLWRKRGF